MRRLTDINLLDDEDMQARMTWASMVIFALGALVGVLAAAVAPHEEVGPRWLVLLGALSVAALPVHELVHAAAFELCSGFSAHVSFGYAKGMLFTSAAGTVLPKRRFCVVLLAPAVMVTSALLAGAVAMGRPLLGWFLAVVHVAGCTGDFGYVRIIASEPAADLVEDTETGIALFRA